MSAATVIGMIGVAAAGGILFGILRRERPWQPVALSDLGQVIVRSDLRIDPDWERSTGDSTKFEFRRVNDTHINGQTSYAEDMQLTLFAEDLEWERIDPTGDVDWKITNEVYERHPVTEPSWRIVHLNREKRAIINWRGFRKHYDLPAAKQYVQRIMDSITITGNRREHFAAHRDWPANTWQQNHTANVVALERIFGKLPQGQWQSEGIWHFTIDTERPRHFVLIRRIAKTPKPDGPMDFRGPITRFNFVGDYLRQDNQGSGGGKLPPYLLEPFRKEFDDPTAAYYYSIQTLNLWQPHASIETEINRMRGEFDKLQLENEAGRLITESPRR